ncbi:MAG: phosphate acetyltransferase [Firmicutes bacterium]|nr:phosphate acetyltransferase [Bacillota bacterium]MBR6970430.1 phosphate acetyltransferase [Bacillota bacterium]
MFDKLIAKVKENPKTIVFTEGVDARIQEAASKLLAEKLMGVILVGVVDEVKKTAAERGFDISGAQIIDPATYEGMDEMVNAMVELRKGKMSPEDCHANLLKGNYFGTMLVKMGKADCLLGGATYSTADTVRPALQLVKTKPGAHLVSSCFILNREDGPEELRTIAMGDCAINIDYQDNVDKEGNVTFTAGEKLAEVAEEIYKVAPVFGIDPKLAMLSFSTKGSGKGGTVALSQAAIKVLKEKHPDWNADGEMQFDAAVSPVVGQLKFPGSKVAGYANTFVFPCIEAGNIGYKIAQRLGGYAAYGPISLGLNAPINDLSRGCDADEVYKMSIITAAL